MKTRTDLTAGTTPLSQCKNVSITPHKRGSTQGNKYYAKCPIYINGVSWVKAQAWFPSGVNVVWDETHGKLTRG